MAIRRLLDEGIPPFSLDDVVGLPGLEANKLHPSVEFRIKGGQYTGQENVRLNTSLSVVMGTYPYREGLDHENGGWMSAEALAPQPIQGMDDILITNGSYISSNTARKCKREMND